MTMVADHSGLFRNRAVEGVAHLAWIPLGGAVGFGTSFVLGDRLPLPVDLYYLLYFTIVPGFLVLYGSWTGLDVRGWLTRRLGWGIALGILGGAVLARGVLAHPGTSGASGLALGWDVLWRGVVYGVVDGLLLFAFPWIVAWRALGAETAGWRRKLAAGATAWAGVLLITTAYHLGYGDFRSRKILQPNVGATISAVPTLVSANPVASPVSHVVLHVTAVLHVPDTELYLPPHRTSAQPGRQP